MSFSIKLVLSAQVQSHFTYSIIESEKLSTEAMAPFVLPTYKHGCSTIDPEAVEFFYAEKKTSYPLQMNSSEKWPRCLQIFVVFFINLTPNVTPLTCLDGHSFDDSVPSTIATGCFSCHISIATTVHAGITHHRKQWGGYACSSHPPFVWTPDIQFLTPFPETTCTAHVVYSPQPVGLTTTKTTISTTAPPKPNERVRTYNRKSPGCQVSKTVDICESDEIQTFVAYCVCCEDECNGHVRCGAVSIVSSLFITITSSLFSCLISTGINQP